MRRAASVVFVLTLMIGLTGGAAAHAAERTVRVGIYENEPKVFIDEAGQPSGIFVDLLEAIATEEGWELEYIPGTWSEGLSALQAGEIDLMPDVAYTEERGKTFDFHEQYVVESWSYVYVSGRRRVDGVWDLEGLNVAVLRGSVQETELVRVTDGFGIDVSLVPADSLGDAFERVREGEADGAVSNRFFGDYSSREYGLVRTPIVFGGSRLYYAVARGRNADLIEAIDLHVKRWFDEPGSIYYTTLEHYTGDGQDDLLLRNVQRVLTGVAVALFVSLGAVLLLRWQVNVRTRDLRAAQAELLGHRNRLEALVAERTAQLEAANVALERISRAKSEFLAFMSHEFRNELNTILGFSRLLLATPGDITGDQLRQVEFIAGSAGRLRALMTDVLDLAKAESGSMQLVCERFDLANLVDDVIGSFAAMAEERGNDLVSEFTVAPVVVDSDEGIVRQILANLVSNALKFTEGGRVTVSVVPREKGALLEVSDTGKGLTEEEREHLFDEFWQSIDARRRSGIGTGLGLSICMQLASLLGGSIEVESTPGVGSTFTLALPLHCGGEEPLSDV